MTEQDRPKKRPPLPLEALDEPALQPPLPPHRSVSAPTKPIDFAPAPPSAEPIDEARVQTPDEPKALPSTGGTKPTPYAHQSGTHDGDAQGYAVRGFTPNYEPDDEPMVIIAPKVPFAGIGDAAREHLHLRRGKPSAWAHVVAAFLLESALVAVGLYAVVVRAGAEPVVAWAVGAVLGVLLAYLFFRDRWRCIEAFTSRYAIEPPGLALLYAPLIALLYANARAARKLVRR